MKDAMSFLTMAAEQSFALLGREMRGYAPWYRVRGEIKEDRDLLLYALWEKGVFRNEEIGKVFGLFYSAFSHIVRNAKEQIKKDHRVVSKVKRVNPHFKM